MQVVIVAASTEPLDLRAAAEVAARLGLPVAAGPGEGPWLKVGANARALFLPGTAAPLRHAGALGIVRIRRLLAGDSDVLVDALALQPGEQVLDATAGLCADALVLAHVVGPEGRVLALEASGALAEVMAFSLAHPHVKDPAVRAAAARVELRHAEHAQVLAALPDRAFDVVYLDPMFLRPAGASPDFVPLRAVAHPAPLDPVVLAEARRVARRRVVVKDAFGGARLQQLGLRPIPGLSRGAGRRYGALPPT